MTAQRHKTAMNLAIDSLLDSEAQEALEAHLDRTPDDADLWERLQRVDWTLRAAPHLKAPAGFSERLMAALMAGRQPRFDGRLGLGIALGLSLVAVTAIPIFGVLLFITGSLLSDMSAFQVFLGQINMALGTLTHLSLAWVEEVQGFAAANPYAVAVATLGVPLTVLWFWMVHTLTHQESPITYRIPVRVVAG